MLYNTLMQPAIFLDLDNTIVQDSEGKGLLDELSLMKGAAPAIASLRGLGYRIVVVANQEGVARGQMSEDDVHRLHTQVSDLVKRTANGAVIDAFYYCPYHPQGQIKQYRKDHPTRKPRPGMLHQAAEELKLDLRSSWMIGDELADVQAGHAAGTRTILLRPDAERLMPIDPSMIEGVVSEPPDRERPTGPDFFAVNLVDAARLIAQQPRMETHEIKTAGPDRKWDAEKIAKIQVPRPAKPAVQAAAQASVRAFRPWGAPAQEDDVPIVAKPFRKRVHGEPSDRSANEPMAHPGSGGPELPAAEPAPRPDIPAPIRQAIEKKKLATTEPDNDAEGEKTLRLILHELRAQRGSDQEFSFLTIVAVALQLVAVICLLGGLFMGGEQDGVFLRWLGAGIMAQLTAIATVLYGR